MLRMYRKYISETSFVESCYVSFLESREFNDCNLSYSFVDGLIIRLYDCWERFCKDLIVKSALHCPKTISGYKLPKSPIASSIQDIINNYLDTFSGRSRNKPRWWEPKWGDINTCLQISYIQHFPEGF